MRLIKLTIKNFKGIEFKELEPNGRSINIYGANALKKTSHNDAYSWLLTDKDSQNRSAQIFGIKPREVLPDGSLGEVIIGAEPEVEGVFELENGKTLTLKKQHTEKWQTPRGKHEEQLTGYTTNHWINEEPIDKATDFKDRLQQIVSDEQMKMLTNPLYVAEEMSKSERRDLLIEIIDGVDDQDIIDENPQLEGYVELLDGRKKSTVENILSERKKILNKKLGTKRNPGELPARIDENQLKITDPEQSRADAGKAIVILKENLEGKRNKLTVIKNGGGVAELNQKVQEIEAEEAKYLNEHRKKIDESLKGQREKVFTLEDKVDEVGAEYREAVRQYKDAKTDIEAAQEAAERIADDIQSESERQPEPKQEKKEPKPCPMGCPPSCPECGANLLASSKDDHEDHYEEYVKGFNDGKAKKLKKLKVALQEAENKLSKLNSVLEEKEQKGAQVKARKEQREEALEKAKADLQRMKDEAPKPDTSEFSEKRRAILEKIDELKRSRQTAIDEVKNEIEEIEAQIEEHQKVIREHENNDGYRERIEELRKEIKALGKESIEVDRGLHLIEDFTRAHAIYITEKVNKKFNLVNWRMFKDQINGGLEERCDPVYNSMPWDDLSTSEKIKCGLDIIDALSKHFGKSLPVWVDNRESCTELPDTDLQVISLIVSPQDKRLRVETAEKELAVA